MEKQRRVCGRKHLAKVRYLEFLLYDGRSEAELNIEILGGELHKVLVPPRGLFASGRFDQHRRDIAYATLAEVFQSLVRPLLGQSEAELGWVAGRPERGAGSEWSAYRQPRSRAGACDWATATSPGPAAAGPECLFLSRGLF
jgi:hypothetical protein